MESLFLAETVKYLWLLSDFAAGPDNLVENGPYKYIFSTKCHLIPAAPQISLKQMATIFFSCSSFQKLPASRLIKEKSSCKCVVPCFPATFGYVSTYTCIE